MAHEPVCPLCGRPVIVKPMGPNMTFPFFLPKGHTLERFSGVMLHANCFDADPDAAKVAELYARYRAVCNSTPRDILNSRVKIEEWQRKAFGRLWSEDGFRTESEQPAKKRA